MISIAEDFSAYPAGRDEKDGPYNGSRFRKELLVPRLNSVISKGGQLTVSLDGVLSFGSSFLEEAFGGLVRQEGFTKSQVIDHLSVVSSSPGRRRYIEAIKRYVDRA